MKIWERINERRLRKETVIGDEQFGFMPGKGTTDAVFALRQLMERHREMGQGLHMVFIDLEKACDRVPRQELLRCMRRKGVTEKYVRIIQDMYEGARTQGFADNIFIASTSKKEIERKLDQWIKALEDRVLKISKKAEYLNFCEEEGERMKVLKRVKVKYHGSVGTEIWPTKKPQERKFEVVGMKMLRWMCGVTRLNKIRNERIRWTVKVEKFSKKCQEIPLGFLGTKQKDPWSNEPIPASGRCDHPGNPLNRRLTSYPRDTHFSELRLGMFDHRAYLVAHPSQTSCYNYVGNYAASNVYSSVT
ncbi:uncharacterized protein [Penaeus vannamei]|uniref:uncharacterized protein n=1 Tax=Penaeus vannamei TaxID=6689 RepID=UPI000F685C5B|nr:uncharacterized protein LOC113800155 [Penaeus vannamei]